MTDKSFLYKASFPFQVIEHPSKGIVVLYRFLEKVLFISDNDSQSRLEDETQEEYYLRRYLIKKQDKQKRKARVIWPSLNIQDLIRKEYRTSLGTYDKKKIQAEMEKMIKEIDQQEKEKIKKTEEEINQAIKNNTENGTKSR